MNVNSTKVYMIFTICFLWSCQAIDTGSVSNQKTVGEQRIRQMHTAYVDGWKRMDEEQVMGLFEDGAIIQPIS